MPHIHHYPSTLNVETSLIFIKLSELPYSAWLNLDISEEWSAQM